MIFRAGFQLAGSPGLEAGCSSACGPYLGGIAFIFLQPVGGYDKAYFCLVGARGLISDDVFLFQALSSLK